MTSPADLPDPILSCAGMVKGFPGVRALKGVDFAVRPGRVHGLVGENGAGKSTLTKIMAGVYAPDDGRMTLDGTAVTFAGASDALARGIVTIHQDINLIPSQTVAENLLLNNEPTWGLGFINGRAMRQAARDLLAEYGIAADPDMLVAELPNDVRKMLQIAKAVVRQPRVLLMDEPTSSLTETELRLVLKLIRDLAARGTGIVFISHYLAEVFEICDEITVMRDGEVVLATERARTSVPDVVAAMIGRRLESETRSRAPVQREPLLEVQDLSVRGSLRDVSFTLGKGEILGVTGLTGSGLTELAKAVFGSPELRRSGGAFRLDGRPVDLGAPHLSIEAGLALLTNDRLREGILPDFPLYENICLPVIGRFAGRSGLLDVGAMVETGAEAIRRFRVRAPGPETPARSLSGGNQQKVLFAKWLETRPRVFIMDEPTIGIDVGSKAEIRQTVEAIAATGVGILLVTTELEDLTTLCDRVLVMFRGAIVRELAGEAIDRAAILHASTTGALAA